MAGTGVSIGGAGMLRARRRDVSVKPNRKLDRKSSRGMIYENEELRLRTININAEVEQGQHDIKKLRRENEQLRHEIWSLRDEYDKLEEILKSQKNREAGDDYEDRSEAEDNEEEEEEEENDAEECSDYSEVEAEEDNDEKEKNLSRSYETDSENSANQDERLENAENQKISSEKMSNRGARQLHVEFDDLSVVDEEDESKKDRSPKETASLPEDPESVKVTKDSEVSRKAQNGYQSYSPRYGSPGVSTNANFYRSDQKFTHPSTEVAETRGPFSIEPPAMTMAQRPGFFDQEYRRDDPTYGDPVGWRSDVFAASIGFPNGDAIQESSLGPTLARKRGQLPEDGTTEPVNSSANPNSSSLSQRRKLPASQTQLTRFYGDPVLSGSAGSPKIQVSGSIEALPPPNGWDFGMLRGNPRETTTESEDRLGPEDSGVSSPDRPKHFFAPLAPTVQHWREDSTDKTSSLVDSPPTGLFESFGTGKSSGSDGTCSTVVSARHFQPRSQVEHSTLMKFLASSNVAKGPADICVNGAVAAEEPVRGINVEKSYTSSNDLFIPDAPESRVNGSSGQGSGNPVKSASCHDLSYDQVETTFLEMSRSFQADPKCQKLTKSDNSLDSPAMKSSKPFRSQLNVTLKSPCPDERAERPSETPEIPKLPSIDYRLFNNPFLKTFDARLYPTYEIRGPTGVSGSRATNATIDREALLRQQEPIDYSSAPLTQSFARRLNPDEKMAKATRDYCGINGTDRHHHRGQPILSCQSSVPIIEPRNTQRQRDFQATSFESPDPRSLRPGLAYEIDRLGALAATSGVNSRIADHPNLYRNVPFMAESIFDSQRTALRLLYEAQMRNKVPAQTQTSLKEDGPEDESPELTRKNSKSPEKENYGGKTADEYEASLRRKRSTRKERAVGKVVQGPLSPAAQRRRLRKQASIDVVEEPDRSKASKIRQLSPAMTNTTTTTTTSDHTEEKIESRSSSSGQDSPRKRHNRRVSVYFNGKKRPSVGSVEKTRSFSVDGTRENFGRVTGEHPETTNSERERTNSASSREAAAPSKSRKSSVSSGKVPWCACWGNGCV